MEGTHSHVRSPKPIIRRTTILPACLCIVVFMVFSGNTFAAYPSPLFPSFLVAPPVLSSPTVTNITETTAVLGATVDNNGGNALTARGTVYKTSSPVSASDNPLAEGGTATGAFSHTRSNLLPQTQYYFAGYATNSSGTALSPEGNFRTLSSSPTAAVTGFAAAPFSSTQINLYWNMAGYPSTGATATGYIILRKTGSNPTTEGIMDAVAPASLSLPMGTTLIATISSGSIITYANTGLSNATQYNYLIVPFTWDGTNAATYNYFLTGAPITVATTTMYQTFACNNTALNSNNWSTASASPCATTFGNAFTGGSIANFCTAGGTGLGASLVISGINATETFTLSTPSGSITNQNNKVAIIDVTSGKVLDFSIQPISNGTTAGYVKNGDGALAWIGGTYSGGFTLNGGTLIARHGNAMGNNSTLNLLTLNAGTVASVTSSAGSFFGKFVNIIFGGDIQFGSTTAPADQYAGISFTNSMYLGNVLRTLTLGNSGAMYFGGVISNTGSNGITFTATPGALGRFDIAGTSNTFSGPVNINGVGSSGLAEVRILGDGSLGDVANTININGGRLSTPTMGGTFEITSTRGIHVGNISSSSISVINPGTLTFNGVISDLAGSTPGSWAKQGAGILSLGGISTYTGSTTVSLGTLLLTTGNNRLPVGTTIIMGEANPSPNTGTLDLNGFNQQVAGLNSLSGSNTNSAYNNIITSTGTATLTLGGSGTYTYGDGTNFNSGIITGAISLVKSGSGLQTLGDANTYTGSTTVSGGELRLNPSVNTAMSGALTMNGGILGTSGIANTRTLTFSSFNLSDNSKIDLSTDSIHTITFTTAGTFTATKQLVIYGWQGTSGMPGEMGRIFFGNSSSALTPSQLAQIKFNDGTISAPGAFASALILSNGEIVPDAFVNATPTIVMNVTMTSNYLDGGMMSSPATPYALSGVIDDPTDPFSMWGIDFTVNDAETGAASLIVTGASSNESVVPGANVVITGTGADRNAKVIPTGVGYADISISVSDGVNTADYIIKYAASTASVNSTVTRFLSGTSDASTVQPIDNDYMFVADDQNQVLRLYNQHNSGLNIYGNDFSSSLGISMSNPQVDIEGSVKVGNRIYWLGSHSNADDDGALRPNRYRLFATDIAGTGESSTLSYVGRYDNLRTDLINWDANNGHGLGANYFGLTASAASGVIPEAADGSGFNIEGIAMSPDNAVAYIGFRAPISPANDRTSALIVPLTNIASLVSGNPSAGPATFGAPILLDLGGRGIREMMRNATNGYIIIAGPADATDDFRIYTWTGNPSDPAELRTADLSTLMTGGKIESIVDVPDPILPTSTISLVVDNGETVYYDDAIPANQLPQDHHKKFRVEEITIGCGTMVYNNSDSGVGSLRDVIACAPEGSVIYIANALSGSMITLSSGEILIDKNLTIVGPGAATALSLSGNNATRIFHVVPGKTLTLKNMSLVHATAPAPHGGALYIEGNLTLQNMILDDNFEEGIIPKAISINSPGGVVEIIGNNVQIKQ